MEKPSARSVPEESVQAPMTFEVMVAYPEILEMAIEAHNKSCHTDFKVVETVDDEVQFCKISASSFTLSDIFVLGHRLSVIEHELRDRGQIDL